MSGSPDPADGVATGRPDLVLDCRGLLCPLPVIRLAQRIGEVPVGGTLGVTADDAAARVDVPAWCRMRGQEYVGVLPAGSAHPAHPAGPAAPTYVVRRTR